VQKYEKGANRVAASTLVEIARALGTTPEALLPTARAGKASLLDDLDMSAALASLNSEGRRLLLRIARGLAQDKSLRAPRRKRR
jgi:transcriptional regulator with XRE-family HTH domain